MAQTKLHTTENLIKGLPSTGFCPLSSLPEQFGAFGSSANADKFGRGYDKHSNNFKDKG